MRKVENMTSEELVNLIEVATKYLIDIAKNDKENKDYLEWFNEYAEDTKAELTNED